MNINEMINKINKEMHDKGKGPDNLNLKKFKHAVILAPVYIKWDILLSILKGLGKKYSPVLLLNSGLKGRDELSFITESVGKDYLYFGDDYFPVRQILDQTECVIVPEMPLDLASRINLLMPDDNFPKIILESVLKKIPVIANFSVTAEMTGDNIPFTLKNKVNELRNNLKNMGITFKTFPEICRDFEIDENEVQLALQKTDSAGSMKITCDSPECSGCGLCLDKNIDAVKNIIENGADRIGSKPGITSDVPEDVAKYIDHTLLKPQVTDEEIRVLCDEARRYKFASVCVNPAHVEACSRLLKGSPVKVCTVIGFPLGATTSQVKAFETREAITKGAEEIDMVINIGALKSKKYSLVEEDIREVVKAAQGRLVKVILETGLLNQEEKVAGCLLSKAAGADFVKTSTGFGPGGATAEDIFLMRTVVGKEMGVKASGGVKDYKTAKEMIDAGATRIGASAGVKIIKGDSDSSGKEKPADY